MTEFERWVVNFITGYVVGAALLVIGLVWWARRDDKKRKDRWP